METLIALADALEASALGAWARGSAIGYPAANLVHLLGLVMLVGAIGVVDLRVAGLFRQLPLNAVSRALTPIAIAGLILVLPSGFVMFAADAGPLVNSATFRWKLALIVLALANALAFRALFGRRIGGWTATAPAPARAMAATSIGLWLLIGAFGRMIAYT